MSIEKDCRINKRQSFLSCQKVTLSTRKHR